MSSIISALYSVIGEYGVTVALFVLIMQLVVLPFELRAEENEKKKKLADPRIKSIRKRYGVNAMGGFDPNRESELDPKIRAMSEAEKEKQVEIETENVYRETGYRPFTGFIPGFLKVLLIILLYIGIRAACPEGIYSMSVFSPEAGVYHWAVSVAVIVSAVVFNLIVPIIKTVKKTSRNKLKRALVAPIAGGIFTLGLTVWIALGAALATTVGVLVLHISGVVIDVIKTLVRRKEKNGDGNKKDKDCQSHE